ncbi:MAG: DUF5060 domain-containing protein, partial [Acidobacteria bacterium]|nr:DUF5060 domain-containing protein [Acidobacteriota bacterium]
MKPRYVTLMIVLIGCLTQGAAVAPAAAGVSFAPASSTVDVYDFAEVTVSVKAPQAANPFIDATVTGQFQREGSSPIPVEGFCDSHDGTLYRIRFMPAVAGRYSYSVKYRQGAVDAASTGSFEARNGKRRGLVRVDKSYPW